LYTNNEEVQVDDKDDIFMIRYEVNRVTIIENLKSHVRELYVTIRYVNRTNRQNELYGSIGKRRR